MRDVARRRGENGRRSGGEARGGNEAKVMCSGKMKRAREQTRGEETGEANVEQKTRGCKG